jgi:hypothetical protein
MTERARDDAPEYRGAERRKHRLYVTKNTEYHLKDGVCVAVRDRQRGTWRLKHEALRRPLTGAVRFSGGGDACPTFDMPEVGDALFFGEGGSDVLTSLLLDVRRPEKDVVENYPL